MNKTLAVCLVTILSIAPLRLLAKGLTTKIVIEGADLGRPAQITDPRVLANFNIWTGPGTFSTQAAFNANAPSFIIDWSQGPVAEPSEGLRRYQVSFYSDEVGNGPAYVVYYAVIPGSQVGYVYLPGKPDKWWRLNVSSIARGVEGKWFHAWSTWEAVARPLIKKARASSTTSK